MALVSRGDESSPAGKRRLAGRDESGRATDGGPAGISRVFARWAVYT
jgi:hypothetical protein